MKTKEILEKLRSKGVKFETVAYHLGYSYHGVRRWWKMEVEAKDPVKKALLEMLNKVKKGGKL